MPPDNEWSFHRGSALDATDRQSRRSALLASVAIHAVIVALVVGVGFTVRPGAIRTLNVPGTPVSKDSAGLAGLQAGRGTWRGGCEWTGDSTSAAVLHAAQHRVSTTDASDAGTLTIPPMDPSLVRPIDSDSLCQVAGRTIDDFVRPDAGYQPRRLFLVRAGAVYLAVDTALRRTPEGEAFVLDSTLSRVLSRGRP